MSTAALSALSAVPDHVIEEHVAATNRFIQLSHYTLDDLHVYAEPLAEAVHAVQSLSRHSITAEQAMETIGRAATTYRALDDAIEAADAAQN